MEEIRNWFIYILKLEKDSWYVGTAKGLRSRLRSHAKKSPFSLINWKKDHIYNSRSLTGKRKATHLHAAFRSVGDFEWVTEIENCITVAMANKYGYDKVRGGIFICSWEKEITEQTISSLNSRFGSINIREKFNLKEVDLLAEKPFCFPVTKRTNSN